MQILMQMGDDTLEYQINGDINSFEIVDNSKYNFNHIKTLIESGLNGTLFLDVISPEKMNNYQGYALEVNSDDIKRIQILKKDNLKDQLYIIKDFFQEHFGLKLDIKE